MQGKRVPAALERSRSGNGAHVWIFFSEPVPASDARKLGAHLVTETMERCPDIGFESYDRFFPSQDIMPAGGFGNLIALPPRPSHAPAVALAAAHRAAHFGIGNNDGVAESVDSFLQRRAKGG